MIVDMFLTIDAKNASAYTFGLRGSRLPHRASRNPTDAPAADCRAPAHTAVTASRFKGNPTNDI
jgi:hypothetical protein